LKWVKRRWGNPAIGYAWQQAQRGPRATARVSSHPPYRSRPYNDYGNGFPEAFIVRAGVELCGVETLAVALDRGCLSPGVEAGGVVWGGDPCGRPRPKMCRGERVGLCGIVILLGFCEPHWSTLHQDKHKAPISTTPHLLSLQGRNVNPHALKKVAADLGAVLDGHAAGMAVGVGASTYQQVVFARITPVGFN